MYGNEKKIEEVKQMGRRSGVNTCISGQDPRQAV